MNLFSCLHITQKRLLNLLHSKFVKFIIGTEFIPSNLNICESMNFGRQGTLENACGDNHVLDGNVLIIWSCFFFIRLLTNMKVYGWVSWHIDHMYSIFSLKCSPLISLYSLYTKFFCLKTALQNKYFFKEEIWEKFQVSGREPHSLHPQPKKMKCHEEKLNFLLL